MTIGEREREPGFIKELTSTIMNKEEQAIAALGKYASVGCTVDFIVKKHQINVGLGNIYCFYKDIH